MAFENKQAQRIKKAAERVEIELDFDDDDDDDIEEKGAPAWLSSYSDMMTDLMAIFVVLFSFAMMATSQQNYDMKEQMQKDHEAANAGMSANAMDNPGSYQFDNEFDDIFDRIQQKIEDDGYADSIHLEKSDGYITFRFKDNVLFYPDSPVMRETSFDILEYMGDMLLSVEQGISSIEISGFTAKVGDESTTNFVAWELSSDRAISVLKFFVTKCDLPQSKMFVSGYSHYRPIAGNDTEEDRSLNRRVEVKIVRIREDQEKILDAA